MLDKKSAEQLWTRLRNGFLLMDEVISEIVANRAWEPLGFDSFAACWAEKMAGVRLAGAMKAHVVYALFDSGASVDDVADAVTGVGPVEARGLSEAYSRGVAAEDADVVVRARKSASATRVREHERRRPVRRGTLSVSGFEADELKEWRKTAEDAGVEFDEWMRRVVRTGVSVIGVVERV